LFAEVRNLLLRLLPQVIQQSLHDGRCWPLLLLLELPHLGSQRCH
jgi:hypothetical protein